MKISESVRYIGVNDHMTDLFEGQYPVPGGMSYNSYVILDEKVAVTDTVDAHFADEWLAKLDAVLAGRLPDYLIVHHMEPDHSAGIARFAEKYPSATIVASAKAFAMMQQFFGCDFASRRRIVKEGDALPLGTHTLSFLAAPMVHWPEVMLSYEASEKLLFSADAFGKFGALDCEEPWDDEARRYYIGIVGKYGAQVQALLKKAAALEIRAILPLHGPMLTDSIPHCVSLYDTWSSYRPEAYGTVIVCASVYGATRDAAMQLADKLRERGEDAAYFDLTRCDMSAAVAAAFRYDRLVLASVTYNGGVFPCMRAFLDALNERGFRSRTVACIENGSWAPQAAMRMKKQLEEAKDITFAEHGVRILSALDADSRAQLAALADELAAR